MEQSLETKVEVLTERLSDLLDRLEREDLEKRVRALENSRAAMIGASAFGGALLGWIGNLILTLVK